MSEQPESTSAVTAMRRMRFIRFSVLKWFRFQFHLAVDGLDAESNCVHVVLLANRVALLLHHRRQLIDGDVWRLAELHVLPLDLVVQLADLVAVRARRHLYIRVRG